MQQIIIYDLDKYFAELLKKVPEERRAMFEDLADSMLSEVRAKIGGAGKVQSWQEKHVGSGGGYAAARPAAKTFDEHQRAVGAITNAIESGHQQRPGLYIKDLGKRLKKSYVPGKHFYADAHGQLERMAREAMARFERRVQEELNK